MDLYTETTLETSNEKLQRGTDSAKTGGDKVERNFEMPRTTLCFMLSHVAPGFHQQFVKSDHLGGKSLLIK